MQLRNSLKLFLFSVVAASLVLASSAGDGDIMSIHYGNGFCVNTAKSRVTSRVLYQLALRTSAAFVSSGYGYAREQAGKWTVEIVREDTGYSQINYIADCFNWIKGTMFQLGDETTVGSHAMGSVGIWGGDGSEGTRIYVWITEQISGSPGYRVLIDEDESVLPLPKVLNDSQISWKGPGRIISTPQPLKRRSRSLLGQKYWDACTADDDNNSFYNMATDNSVRDCIFDPFGALNCQFCCNGCSRSGSSCCPSGQFC